MKADEKRIMILGAGVMQIPALEIAHRNGWKSLCVDGDPSAPGRLISDDFYPIDLKNIDELVNLAKKVQDEKGLDGVFTVGTDFSVSVASITDALGLPGISKDTALNATDKVRMRKCFKAAGVASPQFFETNGEIPKEILKMSFPVVVKPVDSMGARGVVRIDNSRDLPDAVQTALSFSRSGKAIIEEFIAGCEFSLDAIIQNGNINITGFADRIIAFPPYFVELGHTMPTQASGKIRKAVEKVFCQGISALGINNGAAKGDIKWDGRRAVVGEIAARLSGGFMSGWTYPLASGFSSIESGMRISMGLPAEKPPIDFIAHSAERAFLSIPGTVSEIILPEPKPDNLYLRIKVGDKVVFPRNNVEKCGNIIVSGQNRNTVIESAENYISSVLVKLKPEDPDTADFLNNPPEWIPLPFENLSEKGKRFRREVLKSDFVDFRKLPDTIPNTGTIPVWKNWDEEISKDWNGRSMADSLKLLHTLTGRKPEADSSLLQEAFFMYLWKAFFNGGIQGVLWFLERYPAINHLS